MQTDKLRRESHHPFLSATSVAVVGLGYVGLPTAVALHEAGATVIGIDTSESRLADIRALRVDAGHAEILRLDRALAEGGLVLTSEPQASRDAQSVIIAVPSPVDSHLVPDLSALKAACSSAVANAVAGQTIILVTTSYVGTTRDLLIDPLEKRGMVVGTDVFVAFSPERIDPGTNHRQEQTVRVLGAATTRCFEFSQPLIRAIAAAVHRVESPEMAEFTKLYENIYRAVNIALANEMADIARSLGLSQADVIAAASTKSFGFSPFFPGAGVGGHCIPCDPHFLLWQLRGGRIAAPLIEPAMAAIARRPTIVVGRALELLAARARPIPASRILVIGVSYKPGVADVRGSPALEIIARLEALGAIVDYFDPMVPSIRAVDGVTRRSLASPDGADFDLVIAHTAHPEIDLSMFRNCNIVLDATYRIPAAENVVVV